MEELEKLTYEQLLEYKRSLYQSVGFEDTIPHAKHYKKNPSPTPLIVALIAFVAGAFLLVAAKLGYTSVGAMAIFLLLLFGIGIVLTVFYLYKFITIFKSNRQTKKYNLHIQKKLRPIQEQLNAVNAAINRSL